MVVTVVVTWVVVVDRRSSVLVTVDMVSASEVLVRVEVEVSVNREVI
jgi:hypothetical protein